MKDTTTNLNQAIYQLSNINKASSLVTGVTIPATDTNLYTVPNNVSAKLTEIILFNSSGGAVTVNLSIVPSGSVLDPTKNKIYGESITGGAKVILTLGTALPNGCSIHASASSGSVVAIFVTGILQSK